jgi:hypothetical protein
LFLLPDELTFVGYRRLLSSLNPRHRRSRKSSRSAQRNWIIVSIEIKPTEPTYRQSEVFQADVIITLEGGEAGLKAGLVRPTAFLRTNANQYPLSVAESTKQMDLGLRQLRFSLNRSLATIESGAAEVEFAIPSIRDDAMAVARIAILAN